MAGVQFATGQQNSVDGRIGNCRNDGVLHVPTDVPDLLWALARGSGEGDAHPRVAGGYDSAVDGPRAGEHSGRLDRNTETVEPRRRLSRIRKLARADVRDG